MTPLVAPDDCCCSLCGESNALALRQRSRGIVCADCEDTRHAPGVCAICGKHKPIERHHVAGRKHWAVTIPVCLNDHAILSHYQREWLPETEGRSHLLYVMQGVLDCVALWLQRNPLAAQCKDMLAMIGKALLVLVAYLRPDYAAVLVSLTTIDPFYD